MLAYFEEGRKNKQIVAAVEITIEKLKYVHLVLLFRGCERLFFFFLHVFSRRKMKRHRRKKNRGRRENSILTVVVQLLLVCAGVVLYEFRFHSIGGLTSHSLLSFCLSLRYAFLCTKSLGDASVVTLCIFI